MRLSGLSLARHLLDCKTNFSYKIVKKIYNFGIIQRKLNNMIALNTKVIELVVIAMYFQVELVEKWVFLAIFCYFLANF